MNPAIEIGGLSVIYMLLAKFLQPDLLRLAGKSRQQTNVEAIYKKIASKKYEL